MDSPSYLIGASPTLAWLHWRKLCVRMFVAIYCKFQMSIFKYFMKTGSFDAQPAVALVKGYCQRAVSAWRKPEERRWLKLTHAWQLRTMTDNSLAGQPYFSLFSVGGARGREKYVWTLWPASVDIRSNVRGSNLIGSFNIKHIPTIASVKNCVHEGVLQCECNICVYSTASRKQITMADDAWLSWRKKNSDSTWIHLPDGFI